VEAASRRLLGFSQFSSCLDAGFEQARYGLKGRNNQAQGVAQGCIRHGPLGRVRCPDKCGMDHWQAGFPMADKVEATQE